MIVPDQCLPLLREQRTHYRDIGAEYGVELAETFGTFRSYLPRTAKCILDIGCGMAGIDVLLHRHYPDAEIVLLDKQGVSDKPKTGHHRSVGSFGNYHDFGGALELLEANGVNMDRIRTHDIGVDPFPADKFDVVISLLSWGFHYPISTYCPNVLGVIIADISGGTDGEELLRMHGETRCVFEQSRLLKKDKVRGWHAARNPYRRIVCRV
jgi:SAM-dependent methyltransferase